MSLDDLDFMNTSPPPQLPQDRVRVCAYYENGELTNIDICLNHEDVTTEDIEKILAILRVKRTADWPRHEDIFPGK